MSETQLREAYTYMKQGNKKEAIRLVQNVLREDRSNVNAWWLFSMLLEDEEKIIRALEKILEISPEHLGASKRLSQLSPRYWHLASKPEAESPASSTAAPEKAKRGKANSMALVFFFILGAIVCMVSLLMPNIATMIDEYNLANVVGPTPEEVAHLQLHAALNGDYEGMRLHTCDSLDEDWEDIMDDLKSEFESSGASWNEIDVDISGFNYELDESPTLERYFEVTGTMVMRFRGTEVSANIEDMSFFDLYVIMIIEDNHWKVCSL